MLNREKLFKKNIRIILIFVLSFMILVIGYLTYINSTDNENMIKGTRVLGVSYIPEKKNEQENLNKELPVKYNVKSDVSNLDDNEENEEIVMVDDKQEYARVATVKNRI